MITDINCRSEIKGLDRNKAKPYWNEYFLFERDAPRLHELAAAELGIELDRSRSQPSPFLDAQRTISEILTKFGSKHNFHRQFNEEFSAMKPSQVLGMQLYELVAKDADWWVYLPTQHAGHAFPHATYYMPRNDAGYQRLVQRNTTSA